MGALTALIAACAALVEACFNLQRVWLTKGQPGQVRDYLGAVAVVTGATYFVCDFAFGTIEYEEARRSIDLFASEVMAAFS